MGHMLPSPTQLPPSKARALSGDERPCSDGLESEADDFNCFRNAAPGDLIVAMMERPGHKPVLVKGVVGDTGPDLGEATPAFNMALAGANKTPLKNYTEALNFHLEDGNNIKIAMLVLPGSKTRLRKPGSAELSLSQANITKKSEEAFAEWGGGSLDLAEKKFRACFSVLKAPGAEGLATE